MDNTDGIEELVDKLDIEKNISDKDSIWSFMETEEQKNRLAEYIVEQMKEAYDQGFQAGFDNGIEHGDLD